MKLTREQFKACLPGITEERLSLFYEPMTKAMQEYGIINPYNICRFLANIGHESGSLTLLVENMNYSAKRLMQVFPKYFKTIEIAKEYANKPEKIASRVYGNRYGNGPESTGDGWKFRGRSAIHLTFRDNYRAAGKALGYDLENNPDAAILPGTASYLACWFWKSKGLNNLDESPSLEEFEKSVISVNGGLNGYSDRLRRYEICKKVLNIK